MTDASHDAHDALPDLSVPLSAEAVVARIDEASRRGRMPGFEAETTEGLFLVDAWGTPFDHDLIAHSMADGGNTRLSFAIRMRRRMPIIHATILLFTIWPGVWLTDAMLKVWFGWYYDLTQTPALIWNGFEAFTYVWYLPLCVLPLPWYWRGILRRSRHTARASALEMIGKIARELGVSPPPETADAVSGSSTPSA